MGELRVTKRGKAWQWSFEGAKVAGKRKVISKSGYRTKAECVAAGTQAKAEYDGTGSYRKSSGISVADYLDRWMEEYVKNNATTQSQRQYDVVLRNAVLPYLGQMKLQSVEPETLARWMNDLKKAGKSVKYIRSAHGILNGALRYAVYPCKLLKENPCTYARPPKLVVDPERAERNEYVCTKEDIRRIFEFLGPDSPYYLPIVTGFYCGTRVGESYGIDLSRDVDFDNHVLHIRRQLLRTKNGWKYDYPKRMSVRKIVMIPEYEEILKKEILKRKKNMLNYGPLFVHTYYTADGSIVSGTADQGIQGTEVMPICARECGRIRYSTDMINCVKKIRKELGLKYFHTHSLRHTHGTILAENGVQPKAVMERLGHKNLSTTVQAYIFATDKMQQNAADVFAAAVS